MPTTDHDFSYLDELKPTGTAVFEGFVGIIQGDPKLTVVPAGEATKAYFDALLQSNAKQRRRLRANKIKTQDVKASRDQDRKLFPKHIVKGWTGVVDTANNEVKFTVAACRQFLAMVPDHLFDELRDFAALPESFVPDVADGESTGKS